MTAAPQHPVARTYPELVALLAARRKAMEISQIEMNDRIGWPDGYLSTIECFSRQAKWSTMTEWAQALGVNILMAPWIPTPKTPEEIAEVLTGLRRGVPGQRWDRTRLPGTHTPAWWDHLAAELERTHLVLILAPIDAANDVRRANDRFAWRRDAERRRRRTAEKGAGRHARECSPDPDTIGTDRTG